MLHKIRTHHRHPEGKLFAWITLILGLAVSLVNPILSPFIKTILKSNSSVSLFFSFLGIMTFAAAIFSSFILKKIERTSITKAGFIIFALTYFSLIFVTEFFSLTILMTLKTWLQMILLITLGLFVRDFAKTQKLGREEGLHYRFQNIGSFAGALLGGFLATNLGYEFVFVIASSVAIFGFFYFYQKHIIQKHPAIINKKRTSKLGHAHNFKEFFSNRERRKAYFITVILMLWMGFKYLYIPLYVLQSAYRESITGLIIGLSIMNLILLEVKVGKYADKHGIRKPIALGFLIMAGLLITTFFNPFHLLNFLLLACVNVGTAMIEPLQETYLFKNLPEEREEDLYGIYMTADPVAYFLAPSIGATILFFLPFKFLFLIFGIIMLLASYFSWKDLKSTEINNNHEASHAPATLETR